jgi:hypothetical protein
MTSGPACSSPSGTGTRRARSSASACRISGTTHRPGVRARTARRRRWPWARAISRRGSSAGFADRASCSRGTGEETASRLAGPGRRLGREAAAWVARSAGRGGAWLKNAPKIGRLMRRELVPIRQETRRSPLIDAPCPEPARQRLKPRPRSSSTTRRIASRLRACWGRPSASSIRTRSPGAATWGRRPSPKWSQLALKRRSS